MLQLLILLHRQVVDQLMLLLDQVLEVQVVVLMEHHFLVVQQVIHLQQHLPKDNLGEITQFQELGLVVVVEPVERDQIFLLFLQRDLEGQVLIRLLIQVQVTEHLDQFQQ
tara:strand:- start:74 stop:403 length:330 start_codon:yes stop_codon:yes gene_type:complete